MQQPWAGPGPLALEVQLSELALWIGLCQALVRTQGTFSVDLESVQGSIYVNDELYFFFNS